MHNLEYFVCKFYNKEKKLLYVSTARDFNKLLKSIKDSKPWVDEVEFISKSEMLTARMAKEFKSSYVLSLKPRYNNTKNLKFTNYKYKDGVIK